MSLSKNQFSQITGLQQKKYRHKYNLFIVEGTKVVQEFLNSKFELEHLFCVSDLSYKNIEKVTKISEIELKKISTLKTPNNVVCIFKIPASTEDYRSGLILALDDINDPGNLGTIIRLSDWFGVDQIICSRNTVDCFNSKVVQASMGSITRVSIIYTDLFDYLKNSKLQKFAANMKGHNVYTTNLPKKGVLVMGNEANGISEPISTLLSTSLSIPRFGKLQQTESLNVATATAILLSEFKRST